MNLPDNEEIADPLERIALLLSEQDADRYRVRAYRQAADTVRRYPDSIARIAAREGVEGLIRLPAIGRSIGGAIQELVATGRIGLLERLEGQVSPEDLFCTVSGIGEDLAHNIHDKLGIESLEELELAAHDGRLETVPGFGPRRVAGVRDALAGILSRSSRRRARQRRWDEHHRRPAQRERPGVAALLDADAEYGRRAAAGELRRIAPRRFNPDREAWLPVLHTRRGDWEMNLMYSNTARAHELGMTNDWVVIYYERDGEEDQCTVVTETRGPLAGRRVVRGREQECRDHYRQQPDAGRG
ncbi:MAG: helix-hairpin-helix domain-containing protein [Gammaproteobacteria bacterium]|nr:helix-hairpin-helix domain-containing protein [Gammaproteobacteria bacterium]